MIKNLSYKNGFTLIEVIIYLALFAILMAGALTASFNLVESGGRDASRALLAEEGSFVIAKVQWALSGATLITVPSVGGSSSVLSVARVSGRDSNGISVSLPTVAAVTVDPSELVGGTVMLTSVSFYHAAGSGTGINPESLGVRFTLSTHTRGGALLSQEFFSTTSLHK
ncbi:MAG TPA: prepilin-type N-terminal cleavage/methylation domain-containing protein [Candidatus Paceibacterota bacterium]